MARPTQPPAPNVRATLGGDSSDPWVTLRSAAIPLIAAIPHLSTWLSSIDDGLEITEEPDGLAIRVQPKPHITRSRTDVFTAVRRLAGTQEGWRLKWTDD